MRILAIGEIIFDIFDGEAEIGGAPLNFCAHCFALGADSAIISAELSTPLIISNTLGNSPSNFTFFAIYYF